MVRTPLPASRAGLRLPSSRRPAARATESTIMNRAAPHSLHLNSGSTPGAHTKNRIDHRFSKEAARTLTDTEQYVFELLLEGLQNKEMASRLGVSVHTVRYHVHNVFRKLQVANRIELLVAMLRKAGPETL
jgi:DNA-binding NarL/FixJ family response regulator